MINVILVIIVIVVTFLVLMGNLYFLVYFQHPDDKNVAWLPKIVVVLGMSFAYLSVLLLPLDVGNRETNGGLDMPLLWMLVYVIMIFIVVILVPFTIFYYESDDSETSQTGTAIGYTFATLTFVLLLTGIMYMTIGYVDLPLVEMTSGLSTDFNEITCPEVYAADSDTMVGCRAQSSTLSMQTSFVVYLIAMLAWLGWFIFVVLAPIGLVTLPMNLIRSYITRPRKVELEQYAKRKIDIRERTSILLEEGRKLKKELGAGKRTTKQTRKFNKFKAEVVLLEDEMDLIRTAYKERGGNPIKYFAYLIVGILAAVTSLLWFIHLILYVLPAKPIHPFLNNFFISADKAFGLIGTAAYGSFAVYLLWCTVHGNIVLGMRFDFFQVHPMKIGATLMNSLVYNTGITVLSSITVTQFCTNAFDLYAHATSINSLFGAQAQHLTFIDNFFIQFPRAFMAVFCFSIIYFGCLPNASPAGKFAKLANGKKFSAV